MNDISAWVPWIALFVSVVGLGYTILGDRSKKHDARFVAMNDELKIKADRNQVAIIASKLDVVEDKVTIVQNDLKHLPDKDVTHRLEIALGKMENELGKLSAQVHPIARMADRMQEALLEKVMS